MDTLRYEYRQKTWLMALVVLFFCGCAVVLIQAARHNDRGMIIDGLISLNTGKATAFLWILAGVSALLMMTGLYGVVRSLGESREIVIDRHGITAPRSGTSARIVTVPFATITDVQARQVQSQQFLIIHHLGGKMTITGSMLPSKAAFEELTMAIADRFGVR